MKINMDKDQLIEAGVIILNKIKEARCSQSPIIYFRYGGINILYDEWYKEIDLWISENEIPRSKSYILAIYDSELVNCPFNEGVGFWEDPSVKEKIDEYLENCQKVVSEKIEKISIFGEENKKQKTSRQIVSKLPLRIGDGEDIYISGKADPVLKKAGNKAYWFIRGCIEKCNDDQTVDTESLYQFLQKHNEYLQERYKVPSGLQKDKQWKLVSNTFHNTKRSYLKGLGKYLIKKKIKNLQWVVNK